MTLPSIGNSISMTQIRNESGLPAGLYQTLNMNNRYLRAIAQKQTVGSTIKFSDFQGKNNIFSPGSNRTMGTGYALNGRSGWTLGTVPPSNYDDSFANYTATTVMPPGQFFYMNNVAYNGYYVGTNGYLTFNSGQVEHRFSSVALFGPLNGIGFYLCPADNYWGSNGPNGSSNAPSAFAYKYGTTSTGYYFFSANMMAYTYGNSSNDRGWQLNCFWNSDNYSQWVEFVYSPAFGTWPNSNGSGGIGVWSGILSEVVTSTWRPTANKSYCWYSGDRGINWTPYGEGSWNHVGTF